MSLLLLFAGLFSAVVHQPEVINPIPRVVREEPVARWDFDSGTEGWRGQHRCTLEAVDGMLKATATGEDPYFHLPVELPGGRLMLRLRVRSHTASSCKVFWTTDRSPVRGEDKARHFRIEPNGQWQEYSVVFEAPGTLRNLRIDPGTEAGVTEFDFIELVRAEQHPLVIEQVRATERNVIFSVCNLGEKPISFHAAGREQQLAAGERTELEVALLGRQPLEVAKAELHTPQWPRVRRAAMVFHPKAETQWIVKQQGNATLEIAPDGSAARLRLGGSLVAALAPLIHFDGHVPPLAARVTEHGAMLTGDGVEVLLELAGADLCVSIRADSQCEGPVVRVFGPLEQGLFAGLEYLGRGERSSTKLDVQTQEHLRFAPDPMKVTMPLMAFVTDRAGVALAWDNMQLQPVYATPNFFDGDDDHRMALRGRRIDAVVHVDRTRLEELIYWAVKRQGLPPVPEPPRTTEEQWALCMEAFTGPLHNENGWGHCVEQRWTRQPFADIASTIFRLTGKVPELPRLVPGGAHVRNECIYFLTGRAAEWKALKQQQAESILDQQQPDGSFRYSGQYAQGHFEDTASGVCARPALLLLEHARLTGDENALKAGLRTLEYIKRFRTPRGAQVWEIPLHTPDQLASAYLVWAYVRGYELTGDKSFLAEARRWALSGVPFVYLWANKPVMLYATIPVYGATNWRAPCWIGLPVQWIGGVYAYALTLLAPHDDSLDWNHLARGILVSAEQQQVPDGPYAGLLPDSFVLASQHRNGPFINPAALVALRMALEGRLVDLDVATDGRHRVVAPFPVTIRDGKAHVEAQSGLQYQVLVDGERIVTIDSQGSDVIRLE